jgi:hypothetical protein
VLHRRSMARGTVLMVCGSPSLAGRMAMAGRSGPEDQVFSPR